MNYNAYPMYFQQQTPPMQFATGNPYIERLAQLQAQAQMQMQPPQPNIPPQNIPLNGKIVDSIEAVKATDIPMDGNTYYFPKADGTEVYAKKWVEGGKTHIWTFKATLDSEPTNSIKAEENPAQTDNNPLIQAIALFGERFDLLEKRFDAFEGSISNIIDGLKEEKGHICACAEAAKPAPAQKSVKAKKEE